MVDYIESPLGLVVGVGWPGETDPGLILNRALPWWLWFEENDVGARRIQLTFYRADWDALSPTPVIGDRFRTMKDGAELENHPISDISLTASVAIVRAQTVYSPGVWPIPSPKPDRVETRRNATNELITYSNLLDSIYTYTYSYELIENNNIEQHIFDDNT